jgi:hypothetical protein
MAEGCVEIFAREIRPHAVGENEFGVCRLPEQKVAQALFAARTNEEINIGNAKQTRELLSRAGAARTAMPRRAQNGITRRVVDGNTEMEPLAPCALLLNVPDGRHQRRGQAIAPANDLHPNSVVDAPRHFTGQVYAKKIHQGLDFGSGSFPVVGREGVQSQSGYAKFTSSLDNPAHGADAGTMTRQAWQAARGSPPAVPIHDDRDMHICFVKYF